MLNETFKQQFVFSLQFMLTKTPAGKKISGCKHCLKKQIAALDENNSPFFNLVCSEAARKTNLDFQEIYNFAKPHWQKLLLEQLNRNVN
jgi:hypothetical protein